MKKAESVFIISNLVLATFAFAFILSMIYVGEVDAELASKTMFPAAKTTAVTPANINIAAKTSDIVAGPTTISNLKTLGVDNPVEGYIYHFDAAYINGNPSLINTGYTTPGTPASGGFYGLGAKPATPSQFYDTQGTLNGNVGHILPSDNVALLQKLKIDTTPFSQGAMQSLKTGSIFGGTTNTLGGASIGNSIGDYNVIDITKKGDIVELQLQNKFNPDDKRFLSGSNTDSPLDAMNRDYGIAPKSWLGDGWFMGHLGQALSWSLVVAGAVQLVGNLFGFQQTQTNALTLASVGGIMVGHLTAGALQSGLVGRMSTFQTKVGGILGDTTYGGLYGSIAGLAVGLLILQLMWKDSKTSTVEFSCQPWEAPTGGKKCEQCNKDSLRPCSEYRCRSLGQACELVNAGTDNETCVWINPKDVSSPIITTEASMLTPGYKYNPAVVIRPAKRGVGIERTNSEDKCIKAFTPLQFGFSTDEPAQCKIDYNHTGNFSDMSFDFGETSLFLYNHTQVLSLPGPKNLEEQGVSPEIRNDGVYSLFVRCMDKNGNQNEDEFSFKFCVEAGPDTTPAEMVTTNFGKEAPFTYNLSSIPVTLYVNEPADCKWSHEDKTYDSMENNMTCASNLEDMTPDLVYACQATLIGLKNKVDNKFYFRCKDQPYVGDKACEDGRNCNKQSFILTLKGTQPLNIISISPKNETVKGFGETIQVNLQVTTANGYNDNAFCYFSPTRNEQDYILFAETESRISKQRLDLTSGSYTYYVKCVDLGGNSVYESTSFKVESDSMPPQVTRIYKDLEQLKITTDEESTCSYSTSSCSFALADGINMPNSNSKDHNIVWDVSKRYYIKCKDKYENEPAPTECNTIVRGFNAN